MDDRFEGIMRLVAKKKKGMYIFILCIVAMLIRWCYMYLTKNVLFPLSYGTTHPHYGIDYSLEKDIISSVIYLIESVLLFTLKRESTFKDHLLHMFFIVYFMPLNAVAPLDNAGYDFLFLSNIYIVEIIVLLSINKEYTRKKASKQTNTTIYGDHTVFVDRRIRCFCFIICLLFIAFKISVNGFHFSLQLIGEETYENRLATIEFINRTATTTFGRVANLIANLATYIAPIYLLISLKQKKALEIMVALLTILSQFSLYSMKGHLLFIPIVFAIAFYKDQYSLLKIIYGGGAASFFILLLAWEKFGLSRIYYVIVRRAMYSPTWMNMIYFDFFSTHTKLFLTDEVFLLRHFLPVIYKERALTLISKYYFGGLMASPNNGMFAEGYMQFGIIGILAYPVIYKFVFDWVEKVYKNFSKQLNLLICAIIAINLPNVGMFRSSFVMSFIFTTAVLWLIQKYKFVVKG